uniref:Uncharacterized protein n=1 Tax=Picea sitchensis TaxID=3332 RepID=D5A8I1_PICSI|nr:unknown [Picea sitchensis]
MVGNVVWVDKHLQYIHENDESGCLRVVPGCLRVVPTSSDFIWRK